MPHPIKLEVSLADLMEDILLKERRFCDHLIRKIYNPEMDQHMDDPEVIISLTEEVDRCQATINAIDTILSRIENV